jgi:serine/threonine protein kinase
MKFLIPVLYSRNDSAWKIADFGFTTEGTSGRCIVSSARRGTSSYRAPEFFDENATFSNKLDIWSVGCILYEIAIGKKAFANDMAVWNYCRSDVPFNVPLNNTFDRMSEEAIARNVVGMLQRDASLRPSASDLLVEFSQKCQPLHENDSSSTSASLELSSGGIMSRLPTPPSNPLDHLSSVDTSLNLTTSNEFRTRTIREGDNVGPRPEKVNIKLLDRRPASSGVFSMQIHDHLTFHYPLVKGLHPSIGLVRFTTLFPDPLGEWRESYFESFNMLYTPNMLEILVKKLEGSWTLLVEDIQRDSVMWGSGEFEVSIPFLNGIAALDDAGFLKEIKGDFVHYFSLHLQWDCVNKPRGLTTGIFLINIFILTERNRGFCSITFWLEMFDKYIPLE